MTFKYYEDHIHKCKKELVPCMFCSKEVKRKHMNDHLDEDCKNIQVECPYNYIGCGFVDERRKMIPHLASKKFRKQHVELLQNKILDSFNEE